MCATLPIRSRSAIANDEIESVVRGRRKSGQSDRAPRLSAIGTKRTSACMLALGPTNPYFVTEIN